MLLDFEEQIHLRGLAVTGVLHVGTHYAEEAPVYARLGIQKVIWVEANPDLESRIRQTISPYGHKLVMGLVTDVPGQERTFHVTNYDSMSSSILEFGTHPQFSPDTVFVDHRQMTTTTIDAIAAVNDVTNINTLVMDIQGAELLALHGGVSFLYQVQHIYTEINVDEVYQGCAKLDELSSFLSPKGFDLVAQYLVPGQGWGDGLFVRR